MSIRLMAAAWDLDIPSTEKMVLLCLCDFSNDSGVCWPSVPTIAKKCSKGDRTVQAAIQWLRDNGYCSWDETPGKPHRFTLNPRKICTPAETAPPQELRATPAEVADEPSITTNSEDKSSSDLADFIEAWNAVAAPKGAVKCNRLTPERRKKLIPLLKRYPVEDLTEAIDAVGRSAFLTGRTPRKFRASITFLCSPEHVEKLLEGSYG